MLCLYQLSPSTLSLPDSFNILHLIIHTSFHPKIWDDIHKLFEDPQADVGTIVKFLADVAQSTDLYAPEHPSFLDAVHFNDKVYFVIVTEYSTQYIKSTYKIRKKWKKFKKKCTWEH